MGVMACGRNGCDNIMCHHLLRGESCEQYVCYECREEFDAYRASWPDTTRVSDVGRLIDEFMDSPKGSMRDSTDPEDVEQELKKRVRNAYDDDGDDWRV